MTTKTKPAKVVLLDPVEATKRLGIPTEGRTVRNIKARMFERCRKGEFIAVRVGLRTFIRADSIDAHLERCAGMPARILPR